MKQKKCKSCQVIFETGDIRKKYCNKECARKYYNKERQDSGKHREYMRDYYRNNKERWLCRGNTYAVLNLSLYSKTHSGGYLKVAIKEKWCKQCGSKEKLEIHHEVYSLTRPQIIKDILEGRIYYLCRKCHRKI